MATSALSKPTSSVRRRIDATLLALAAANGHGDGKTYADCVACGHAAIVGMGARHPRAFQRGHIVSADHGGTWSVWNLAPMCRKCNEALGTRNAREAFKFRYEIHNGYNGKMLPDPGAYDETEMPEWLPVE